MHFERSEAWASSVIQMKLITDMHRMTATQVLTVNQFYIEDKFKVSVHYTGDSCYKDIKQSDMPIIATK